MSNLILATISIGLHVYWIYKLVTYNWENFEEDSKNDTFLAEYKD